ncbi:hypothetical protein H0H92_005238 [Tricholoma furcatifolium]|nr:hypothetical protein H0H92_005238 [Tricholoma furcatifolium]
MNPPTTPFPTIPASTPITPYNAVLATPTPAPRGRPRGSLTGAKRGRKPRGGATGVGATPGRADTPTSATGSTYASTYSSVHWATPGQQSGTSTPGASTSAAAGVGTTATTGTTTPGTYTPGATGHYPNVASSYTPGSTATATGTTTATTSAYSLPSGVTATATAGASTSTSTLDAASLLRLAGSTAPVLPTGSAATSGALPLHRTTGGDDDGDGDDEMLPAMADDDYSAQLSFQSQSKDNLKVLMDNFSPAQYDRFEAYRRHALPKAAVRKVIQQTLGQQVSQPVAQIVAGFAKVFVGEMVERARAVQARRGESGPLSPDHLREAYRMYQEETGRVGAARPLRGKKLFVR